MHRIDTSTAQVDKFGAGKNGFTDGNIQTGTPATDLDNDFFDMLQEELVKVAEEAGVVLDKSKHDQLYTALTKLFAGNTKALGALAALTGAADKLPYFTGPEAAALTALTAVGRTLIGQQTKSDLLAYLGLDVGRIFLGKRAIVATGKVAKTPGAKWARIRAWSAGGGGGGAGRTVTAGNASQGYGGQSGTYIEIWINIEALTEFDCTIGLGGKGGAVSLTNTANPGTDGGATTITGILNCPGGKGGLGGVLGTTLNTGICIVGTDLPTATQGTIIDRSVADIGAPGAQVGSGPNQSLASRGGNAPGGLGSVGGQAGRQISNADGTGGKGNGHAAGGGGGASITNSDGFGGGDATDGLILLEEFA